MTDEHDQTNRKLKNLERLSLEKSQSKEIRLPDWHGSQRGTPNSFLRSSLFSAICDKDRKYKKKEILFAQNGTSIRFTGEQLNQEDLTLWETLLHITRSQPLGNICEFTSYEILKAMNTTTGKADYERLYSGITRLAACLVSITYDHVNYFQSLIEGGERDEITGRYKIRINRDLIKLYGNSNWSVIDWEKRLQLKRKPLAQALLGYYSCHKTPFPVSIEFLHKLSGSNNMDLIDFKRKVKAALNELVKIGFLESYEIKEMMVYVVKNTVKKVKVIAS